MFRGNEHLHFIGICGIGMSGIAKILLQQGYRISGCDQQTDSQQAQELKKLGCILTNHQSTQCTDTSINIIVRSSDISLDHPEIIQAQQRNIPVQLRAAILSEIMRSKISIAIAGAHGKTTTTALLGHVLLQAQENPTIIVGGLMHEIKSNALYGSGKFLVAEADESDRSFLLLNKTFTIITNIDKEHLNTYQNLDDIKETFLKFINQLPFYGLNVICAENKELASIIAGITTPYITYAANNNADIQINNIQLHPDHSVFELQDTRTNQNLGTFTVNLPGFHNVLNATAVACLCLHLGIEQQAIKNALQSFQGVDRRFTFKGVSKIHGALIFDDYGHHPEEIRVTMQVARAKTQGRIVVVFQPQRFSRTKHLWDDFVSILAEAPIDQLILTDIYPANETPIDGISSQNLVSAIKQKNPQAQVCFIPFTKNGCQIVEKLNNYLQPNDLLLFQGAGKVNQLAHHLIAE